MPRAEYPSQCSVMGRSKPSHRSPSASGTATLVPELPTRRAHAYALTRSILGSAVTDDLIAAQPGPTSAGPVPPSGPNRLSRGRRREDQDAARRISMIFPAYLPLAAADTGRKGDDRIQ